MANQLPLLVFPQKRDVQPATVRGFPPPALRVPIRERQIERVNAQLDALTQSWDRYRAQLSDSFTGLEPETVLVIEIAGQVDKFKAAVERAGLEWLGETDQQDIDPDDDFGAFNNDGEPTESNYSGRLFLSVANQRAIHELLNLWSLWKNNQSLPRGKTPWKHVFAQLRTIRRWGLQEILVETGMQERWGDLRNPINQDRMERFQIEFFFRKNPERRHSAEVMVKQLLQELGGRTISQPFEFEQIRFHAVKAELPARSISRLLDAIEDDRAAAGINLLQFADLMYLRPTGQALAPSVEAVGEPGVFEIGDARQPPVAALLDGVPLDLHDALRGRVAIDDAFDLSGTYKQGERRHGTAMASLIIHGDRSGGNHAPLNRSLYCIPVMQPDPQNRNWEHMPEDIFFEDRVHIAVRRMLSGNGAELAAQAPTIKVINLSIGDPAKQFVHTPSPWARLLDWLSYEYRVLFCVSAGNLGDDIDLGISNTQFESQDDAAKVQTTLVAMAKTLSSRRLLSPSESINAITVGATHSDDSGEEHYMGRRVDILPTQTQLSPAGRSGHGFRRSVKPEVFFPGGRQLYVGGGSNKYRVDQNPSLGPGQKTAADSKTQGQLNHELFTRGTSNATALATRAAVRIHDMLEELRLGQGDAAIPDELKSVLMKTLLVHGARQQESAKQAWAASLQSGAKKSDLSRYLGYGAVDVERVLACTEQRATVLGCGEIKADEVHEYDFPLPPSLAAQRLWRCLVVTLAWFSPINPDHRNLREAKMHFEPGGLKWSDMPLKLDRIDSDFNQVRRGTVQHEVFEGTKAISAFQDGEILRIRVACKKDATENLDVSIPYGLAVTLEVKEDIPIYQEVKSRIQLPVAVRVV